MGIRAPVQVGSGVIQVLCHMSPFGCLNRFRGPYIFLTRHNYDYKCLSQRERYSIISCYVLLAFSRSSHFKKFHIRWSVLFWHTIPHENSPISWRALLKSGEACLVLTQGDLLHISAHWYRITFYFFKGELQICNKIRIPVGSSKNILAGWCSKNQGKRAEILRCEL